MIEGGTTTRTRTAATEAILRRFTRNASHPTYAAMLEVDRAQKTIFVARCLMLRDLQREIEEGHTGRPARPPEAVASVVAAVKVSLAQRRWGCRLLPCTSPRRNLSRAG
ncbi:Tn3 family transposase [Streptomyces sp. NPDC088194]|uniref:Tn3 family transposase n=1 Tax=Streptomyces sp. NPDC088194 TaxID=3154931 RepID=UPI0034507FF0